uniref:Histone-lysine N-methyltransferase CG1716 n=1 Tax=Rhabditophanes sp. KR3021 TaxID=114890 RepID=A0AC35U9D3_9BILA
MVEDNSGLEKTKRAVYTQGNPVKTIAADNSREVSLGAEDEIEEDGKSKFEDQTNAVGLAYRIIPNSVETTKSVGDKPILSIDCSESIQSQQLAQEQSINVQSLKLAKPVKKTKKRYETSVTTVQETPENYMGNKNVDELMYFIEGPSADESSNSGKSKKSKKKKSKVLKEGKSEDSQESSPGENRSVVSQKSSIPSALDDITEVCEEISVELVVKPSLGNAKIFNIESTNTTMVVASPLECPVESPVETIATKTNLKKGKKLQRSDSSIEKATGSRKSNTNLDKEKDEQRSNGSLESEIGSKKSRSYLNKEKEQQRSCTHLDKESGLPNSNTSLENANDPVQKISDSEFKVVNNKNKKKNVAVVPIATPVERLRKRSLPSISSNSKLQNNNNTKSDNKQDKSRQDRNRQDKTKQEKSNQEKIKNEAKVLAEPKVIIKRSVTVDESNDEASSTYPTSSWASVARKNTNKPPQQQQFVSVIVPSATITDVPVVQDIAPSVLNIFEQHKNSIPNEASNNHPVSIEITDLYNQRHVINISTALNSTPQLIDTNSRHYEMATVVRNSFYENFAKLSHEKKT